MISRSWYPANVLPKNNLMVEVVSISPNSNPPYVLFSHAWYNKATGKWVRKGGELWEIHYWRYSEQSLFEYLKGKGLL